MRNARRRAARPCSQNSWLGAIDRKRCLPTTRLNRTIQNPSLAARAGSNPATAEMGSVKGSCVMSKPSRDPFDHFDHVSPYAAGWARDRDAQPSTELPAPPRPAGIETDHDAQIL